MNTCGIYGIALTRPDGSVSVYVGQASGKIANRLAAHRYYLRKAAHPNRHLQAAWNKYGESAFHFRTLEVVGDPSALTEAEERWIGALDAHHTKGGFNQRIAADSNRGLKKSPEAVEAAASYRRGRALSDEHKARIGAANRGRSRPQELRDRISASKKGKPRDPAAVEATRIANTGRRHTEDVKARMAETQRRRWAERKAASAAALEELQLAA